MKIFEESSPIDKRHLSVSVTLPGLEDIPTCTNVVMNGSFAARYQAAASYACSAVVPCMSGNYVFTDNTVMVQASSLSCAMRYLVYSKKFMIAFVDTSNSKAYVISVIAPPECYIAVEFNSVTAQATCTAANSTSRDVYFSASCIVNIYGVGVFEAPYIVSSPAVSVVMCESPYSSYFQAVCTACAYEEPMQQFFFQDFALTDYWLVYQGTCSRKSGVVSTSTWNMPLPASSVQWNSLMRNLSYIQLHEYRTAVNTITANSTSGLALPTKGYFSLSTTIMLSTNIALSGSSVVASASSYSGTFYSAKWQYCVTVTHVGTPEVP